MVIKSLTITENAYNVLKSWKHGDESFSEVIVRVGSTKKGAAARFCGAFKGTDTESFEQRVKKRRTEIENELIERQKKFKELRR